MHAGQRRAGPAADGVSDVFLFGQRDYSMRIWVDPDKLAARSLTAADVAAAIREQNCPSPRARSASSRPRPGRSSSSR